MKNWPRSPLNVYERSRTHLDERCLTTVGQISRRICSVRGKNGRTKQERILIVCRGNGEHRLWLFKMTGIVPKQRSAEVPINQQPKPESAASNPFRTGLERRCRRQRKIEIWLSKDEPAGSLNDVEM